MSSDLESVLTIPFWPLGPAFHRLCRTQPNLDPKVASALDLAEATYARSGLKKPTSVTGSPAWSNLIPDQTREERPGSITMLSKIPETPELEKSVAIQHPDNSKPNKRPYPADPSSSPNHARNKLRLDENTNQGALDSGNDQSSRRGSECVSTPITPIGIGKARRPTASDLFEEEVPRVSRFEKPKHSPDFSFQSSWNRPVGAASSAKDGRAEQDLTSPVHREFLEDRIGHRLSESSTGWAGMQPNSNRHWNFGGHKSRHSYTEIQGHARCPAGERERTNSTPETRDSRRSSFESASYSPNRTTHPDKDNYNLRVSHFSHLKGSSSRRSLDHVDENRPRARKFSHHSGPTYHSQPGGGTRHGFEKYGGASSPGQQGPLSSSFSPQHTQRDPQLGIPHFGAPVTLNGQETDPRESHFPLDKRIMYAIDRNVRLSTDQYIVEAFCRIGTWLERKGIWKQDDWGTLRATELARFLDIGGSLRLEKTLKRNFPSSFEQILVRARERKVVELDETGDQMIVHLSKDFTPRGLFYRPLIRSLKSHYFLEKKTDVEVSYLERNYLSKQAPTNKLSDVLPPGFSTHTYIQWAHGERVVQTSRDTETRKRVLVQLSKEWFRSSCDKDLKEVPKLDRSVMAQIEALMAESSDL